MTTSYIYVYYYKQAEASTREKVVTISGNAPDRLRFLFLIIGEEYEYIE
nr:MAG TPA: hypothetical protein [Caudoviricetes sp.]